MRADERARAEERATLRPRLAPVVGPAAIPILIALGLLVFYIRVSLSDPPDPQTGGVRTAMVIVALGTSMLCFLLWENERFRIRRLNDRRRPKYAPDLAAHEIEEWDLTITEAVEVWDPAGEFPEFYLALEDGRVLFIGDRCLIADVKARRFPNRIIHITRLPHAGDTFALECRGAYLAPSYRRDMFSDEEYKAQTVPEDGQILPGPIDRYKGPPVEGDED